ncbi:hypothetical protein HFP89_02585 [Wenzhouxiangella sp. XN79A]|uniref:hypothetical protein n=1 Tax=Wenzhouxiangella sp. XN79A TaxID=2724193 RepID=UPI00144A518C|nr:hypothetical protein [Wenzhouxiangella sp. XN79A]NKI34053.1 hypothetical protein [Wenzhouxiangella sp. XN79A]
MKCTRQNHHTPIAASLAVAFGLALAGPVAAEQVSIQFSQPYPGGGTVTGLLVGEDLDGDGQLYSVAPGLAGFLGLPEGEPEVTYASVRIEGVLGQTITNVFDASVAPITDDANFFWGFSYNLDGGPLGDDPDEGVSFGPLAPSTSFAAGALFAPAWSPNPVAEPIDVCGNENGDACSAIVTLDPVDPFPNFELLFSATSAAPIETHELLRYTFEQDGFDGGASISGTISGRDLDGDGRIYSVGQAYRDFLGYPAGDEVAFATVTIVGVEPLPIVNVVDLVATDVLDPPNFFFGADINVAGDQAGDEGTEGFSIAPFSPSTSYVVGEAWGPGFSPSIVEQGLLNCGNEEGEPCAMLVSLTPNADSPTGVDLKAVQYSAEPIALTPAPFLVDSSFGGHWFNEVPSREGIVIQKIRDGRMLVYWMTYDAEGSQRWILALGERRGLEIVADEVYVTDNGVFAATTETEPDFIDVGELVIEFSDCDSGEVRYAVDGESGTMQIGRLTGLGSDECTR